MSSDPLATPQPCFLKLTHREDGTTDVSGDAAQLVGRQIPAASGSERPDGSWVWWEWDGTSLTVENDALGYRTLYYAARGNTLCISTDIDQVTARAGVSTWNPLAISVFCRSGIWPGNDTAFEQVHTLPPNSRLTWRAGRLEIVTRALEVERIATTRAAAIAEFVRRFRDGLERRMPRAGETAWLPLSGGRDSRYLLLELLRAGVRPRCITARYRPPGTSEDADIAGRLCRALGVEHETLTTTAHWLQGEQRKNRLLSYASAAHSWFIPVAERMVQVGGIAYDGIGGDNTISGYFLDAPLMEDFARGRLRAVAERFAPPQQERALRRWFGDDVYSAMPRDAALERLAEDLGQYQHRPTPVSSWAMESRARRGVAVTQYGYLRRLNAVLSPYMDLDVYRYAIGLPWELLADKAAHTEIIHREFPETADIPFAARGEQQREGAAREFRRRARDLTRVLLERPTSEVLNFPYLLARTVRSAVDGSVVPAIPILLLQLEREVGLKLG